jgi:hypothetical protein
MSQKQPIRAFRCEASIAGPLASIFPVIAAETRRPVIAPKKKRMPAAVDSWRGTR